MQWWLSIASIRLAVVCLLTWLILRAPRNAESAQPKSDGEAVKLSGIDGIWILGAACSLIHMFAVFAYIHHWSHEAAFEHTATLTEELLGTAVGVGVYFNYLFNIVWVADAIWLLVSKSSYLTRDRRIDWAVYGFLLFIAFNGAVVFATGWFRWFSAAMFLLLITSWIVKRNKNN